MLKAVILIGGPQKGNEMVGNILFWNLLIPWFLGTRFRPLSLNVPKPLFPVAGVPMIQHHIEACLRVPNLKEILILGYFPPSQLTNFVNEMISTYKIRIR